MFQNHVSSFEFNSTSFAEAASIIPYGAKIFFAAGTATFINGPANLLNNKPKNHPGWIILDICALDNFKSVDILFLNAFLNLVVCLVLSNNSWGKLFPWNILIFLLKVAPVWFLAALFSLFSCEFDNLTFTLLYPTSNNLLSSSANKGTTGHFVSVILNVAFVGILTAATTGSVSGSASLVALLVIIHFSDQVKIRFILQLINGISSVFQKLLKYFNDTAIFTPSFHCYLLIFL